MSDCQGFWSSVEGYEGLSFGVQSLGWLVLQDLLRHIKRFGRSQTGVLSKLFFLFGALSSF